MSRNSLYIIVLLFLLVPLAFGCQRKTTGTARAAEFIAGQQAEQQGDLHQAAKHYEKAIQFAEQDGYVSEGLYEDLHRVQAKIAEKYGE